MTTTSLFTLRYISDGGRLPWVVRSEATGRIYAFGFRLDAVEFLELLDAGDTEAAAKLLTAELTRELGARP